MPFQRTYVCMAVSLFSAAAFAQDPVPLRYQFTEGETLRYRVTQTATLSGDAAKAGSFDMRTEQVTELAWRVVSVDEEGFATIEQTVPKLRYKNSSPTGKVAFDSESEDPPMGVAAMLAPSARTLLETAVMFSVSATGEVAEINASEDLIASLNRVPGANNVLEAEPALRAMIEAVLTSLSVGADPATRQTEIDSATLGKVNLVTEFTRGPTEESGVARLLSQVSVEPSSVGVKVVESSGVALFIEDAGRLESSDASLRLEMVVDGAAAKVEQTTQVKRLNEDAAIAP